MRRIEKCPTCKGRGKIIVDNWLTDGMTEEDIAREKKEALADIVEVVRCKDCKKCESYYPSKKEGEEPYPLVYECKPNRKCVLPTHFCACGERREK